MSGRKSVLLVVLGFTLVAVGSGQWLEATIEVPDTMGYLSYPSQVFSNPLTGRVYVTSSGVLVFDPATGEKARRFRDWGDPVYCPNAGKIYLMADTTMPVIDANADTIVGTASLPYRPAAAAYSRTSNKLYFISDDYPDPLLVFDPSGDSVCRTITMIGAQNAIIWDSIYNRVYVGTGLDSGWVAAIDCVHDSVVKNIPTGLWNGVELDLSIAEHKLYCRGWLDSLSTHVVLVFDTDSLQPLGLVQGLPAPREMLYNSVTNRLYCSTYDTLYVVDCAEDTVRARLNLGDQEELAFSPLNGKVYVACCSPDSIAVVDTSDNLAAWIAVVLEENRPEVLGFSRGRNELYCAMEEDVVFIIDASADTIAGQMDYMYYSIRRLIHNPAGNKLYVLCPYRNTIFVIDSDNRVAGNFKLGIDDKGAFPIINPMLNRLYIMDDYWLWTIDCNTDEVIDSVPVPGIKDAILVLHPELNKLYIFPEYAYDRRIWVFDCLRGSFIDSILVRSEVPCAVYHPRSNRIYFATETSPCLNVLDPLSDSVVKTIRAGIGDDDQRMLTNTDQALLYLTNQRTDQLYIIHVWNDSLIDSVATSMNVDTLFWNRRLGKVYACERGRSSNSIDVLDCETGRIIRTLSVYFKEVGVMNDRNDKLYLGGRETKVLDCRCDSVVAVLPGIGSRSRAMAWNQIGNRVYSAKNNRIAVYRDDPIGIEEKPEPVLKFGLALVSNPVRMRARFQCRIPPGQTAALAVYDAAGRRIGRQMVEGKDSPFTITWDGKDTKGRQVPTGVYFARLESEARTATVKVVLE